MPGPLASPLSVFEAWSPAGGPASDSTVAQHGAWHRCLMVGEYLLVGKAHHTLAIKTLHQRMLSRMGSGKRLAVQTREPGESGASQALESSLKVQFYLYCQTFNLYLPVQKEEAIHLSTSLQQTV